MKCRCSIFRTCLWNTRPITKWPTPPPFPQNACPTAKRRPYSHVCSLCRCEGSYLFEVCFENSEKTVVSQISSGDSGLFLDGLFQRNLIIYLCLYMHRPTVSIYIFFSSLHTSSKATKRFKIFPGNACEIPVFGKQNKPSHH